jgi:hypothetical protein
MVKLVINPTRWQEAVHEKHETQNEQEVVRTRQHMIEAQVEIIDQSNLRPPGLSDFSGKRPATFPKPTRSGQIECAVAVIKHQTLVPFPQPYIDLDFMVMSLATAGNRRSGALSGKHR